MNNITLEDASNLLCMTKTSLCKFLKINTLKSFSKILNEVKISHACKKLIETDMQVIEICYESGYNDVSNFNRRFKEIINLTPLEYRKRFLGKA
jgi:AraC-like DNA-binding protein